MHSRSDLGFGAALDSSALSRRIFLMRASGALVGLSAVGALVAGCGGDESTATGEVSGALSYFGWQGYDDAKAAKPLTARGVTLKPQYITTNDDIATKLRSGGIGSIDIVTPFVGYIPALVAADLIQELDYSKLPSTELYFQEFIDLTTEFGDGKTYNAPLVWGDTPMVINPDTIGETPASWLDLRDPKYKGKLITLDDTYGNILIVSRAINGPTDANMITQTQLDDVVKVWKEIKPNLVTITPSFGDAIDIMARGDAAGMVQGWRFMEVELGKKNIPVEAWMPSEGSFSWSDTYAIPKDAPNPDAAYAFIETMISAQGNAIVGAATGSGVTNKDAVANLPANQADLYPYDNINDFLTTTTGFYALPLEPEGDIAPYSDWIKAWEEIKSA